MKIILTFLLVSLITCCSKNIESEKVIYFEKSNIIKEKYVFMDQKDTNTYHYYSYYENGIIKEEYYKQSGNLNGAKKEYYIDGKIKSIVNFVKGEADGIVQVYNDEGNLVLYKTYKNDKLNGLYILFNNKKQIQQELFHIHDQPIIRADKGPLTTNGESSYGVSYYYFDYHDSIFMPIGSLIYKFENGNRINDQKYCTYFETIAKDTIQNGDTLEIEIISNIGLHQGHQITLFLGDIDEFYNFRDTSVVRIFKSDSNVLKISLNEKEYKPGVNLLTGKLRVYKDGEEITQKYMFSKVGNVPYIFFKQFYVIDNRSNPAKESN